MTAAIEDILTAAQSLGSQDYYRKSRMNKSFINSANLGSMHNYVENCMFFNICVDNHSKLSLNWFLFVYINKILTLDLINHV